MAAWRGLQGSSTRGRGGGGQQLAHEGFSPSVEALARETAINRGPWLAQLRFRAGQTSESELFALLLHVWRAAGCMVLGMALARSGVLAGEHPEVERKLVRFGLLLGVPLSVTSAVLLLLNDFPESAALTMGLVSYVASLPLALTVDPSCSPSRSFTVLSAGKSGIAGSRGRRGSHAWGAARRPR